MRKIDEVIINNSNNYLTEKEIAEIILCNKCGKVLANKESYNEDLFNLVFNYFFVGITKEEKTLLINNLIEDEDIKKYLK